MSSSPASSCSNSSDTSAASPPRHAPLRVLLGAPPPVVNGPPPPPLPADDANVERPAGTESLDDVRDALHIQSYGDGRPVPSPYFLLLPTENHHDGGYTVPVTCCNESQFLSSYAESVCDTMDTVSDGAVAIPIPVQGIRDDIVGIVAAYIVHFSGSTNAGAAPPQSRRRPTKLPQPMPSSMVTFEGPRFEKDVFNKCHDDLSVCLGVLHAANFLGVTSLVHLASLSIALRLRGRSPHDFGNIFAGANIPLGASLPPAASLP